MAEQIWGDRLVVGQALAHRHGDRLADLPAGAHAVLEAGRNAGQCNWKQVNVWQWDGLTSSQVSVLNASQWREFGHWKPKLFISGSQLDLTSSQSSRQGGLGFPDTHFGV